MRATQLPILVVVGVLALAPGRALADPCAADPGAIATGPLQLGFFDGDVARPRRACPRSEVGMSFGGRALIDSRNFYGTVGAGLLFGGSYRYSEEGEVFAAIEAVQVRFVQSAVFKTTRLGLGDTSIGAAHRVVDLGGATVAATGRLTLPTAVGLYENAWPFAVDLGAAFAWRPASRLGIHGHVGFIGAAAMGRGDPAPRLGVQALAGVDFRVFEWLALVLDVGSQHGWAAAVDQVTVAPGLRAALGRRFGLEVGAMVPVAGATRADAAFALRGSWRFGDGG
jgi:hypothetical protein